MAAASVQLPPMMHWSSHVQGIEFQARCKEQSRQECHRLHLSSISSAELSYAKAHLCTADSFETEARLTFFDW
jgi:hypothetical protein